MYMYNTVSAMYSLLCGILYSEICPHDFICHMDDEDFSDFDKITALHYTHTAT